MKTFNNLENVLNETDIDLIGLSRPLISEPDLVTKWIDNPNHQSTCISCNYCHKETAVCFQHK